MAINGRRVGKMRPGQFANGKKSARHPRTTNADPLTDVTIIVTDATTGERLDLPSGGVQNLHGYTGPLADHAPSGENVTRSDEVTVDGRKVTVFAVRDGAAKELPADALWGFAKGYVPSRTPAEKNDLSSPEVVASSKVMKFIGSMPAEADSADGDPIDETERAEAARVRILLDKRLGMKTEPWIFKLARKR